MCSGRSRRSASCSRIFRSFNISRARCRRPRASSSWPLLPEDAARHDRPHAIPDLRSGDVEGRGRADAAARAGVGASCARSEAMKKSPKQQGRRLHARIRSCRCACPCGARSSSCSCCSWRSSRWPARAFWIQGPGNAFFKKQGESRYQRTLELPATRGQIRDRNGLVLATSLPVKAIWAIPEAVPDDLGADKLDRARQAARHDAEGIAREAVDGQDLCLREASGADRSRAESRGARHPRHLFAR